MEPMKPMGTWRDSKLVVDGDEFLKTLVSGVFGKTLPEKASNFMRKEAWDKYVGTRLGKGFFRDRWERKGREAVDGKAASAFLGLVRASFAGEVERHPGTDTSRRLTEFLDTACRPRYDDGGFQPAGASRLDFSGDVEREAVEAKKEALCELFKAVLERAETNSLRSEPIDLTIIPGLVDDAYAGYEKRSQPPDCPVSDESWLFKRMMGEALFLEGGAAGAASVGTVFVPPHLAMVDQRGRETRCEADALELVQAFLGGSASQCAPGFDDDVRAMIILSGPGAGKTTLLAAIASKALDGEMDMGGRRLYCLRLSNLAGSGFVEQGKPLAWILRYSELPPDGFGHSLLLLDGLDELCMGFGNQKASRRFLESMLEEAKAFEDCRLIATSRSNYAGGIVKRPNLACTFKILPFDRSQATQFINKLESARGTAVDDKVVGWLMDMYEELDFLAVPLLLYMTLSSSVDVTGAVELGDLYRGFFDAVCGRCYGDRIEHSTSERINPRKVARVLAAEMRRVGRHRLEAEEARQALAAASLLASDDDEADSSDQGPEGTGPTLHDVGLWYGLAFLYRDGGGRDFAPEFYHRSFVEYLAAEQIFETLSSSIKLGGDGRLAWWREAQHLLGGAPVTDEVAGFFSRLARKADMVDSFIEHLRKWLLETYLVGGMRGDWEEGGSFCPLGQEFNLFVNYWKILKALRPNGAILESDLNSALLFRFASFFRMASSSWPLSMDFDFENFIGAQFEGADFNSCDLREANFQGASLSRCNFAEADLSGAVLDDAIVEHVDFEEACLFGASFRGARVRFCNFDSADLTDVALGMASSVSYCSFEEVETGLKELPDFVRQGFDWGD